LDAKAGIAPQYQRAFPWPDPEKMIGSP